MDSNIRQQGILSIPQGGPVGLLETVFPVDLLDKYIIDIGCFNFILSGKKAMSDPC